VIYRPGDYLRLVEAFGATLDEVVVVATEEPEPKEPARKT
jgi:hypothetical protein